MPCGGIRLAKGPGTVRDELHPGQGGCWMCSRGGCEHFCDEWDTHLHGICALAFLLTPEGSVVINHKHIIIINLACEENLPCLPVAKENPDRQKLKSTAVEKPKSLPTGLLSVPPSSPDTPTKKRSKKTQKDRSQTK